MRARDAGVLLISGLAIFLSLESGSEYQIVKKFAVELKPTLYRNGRFAAEDERIPKPIIDDLDGDGQNEVIVATRDPKLKVFDPHHPTTSTHGHGAGREMILRMKSETTLLSKGVGNVRSGRQPVAMATGFLKTASEKHRHKVVVVLTHDWTVMCFDHHLKLLWESNPMKMKTHQAFHREAAIYISPTRLRPFDEGLVVVGSSMEYQDHKRLHRRKPKSKDKKAESADEKKKHQRDRIKELLGLPINSDNEWTDDNDEWEDKLMHFSYFALEGKRGALRWKHKAGDFQTLFFDHEATEAQHNYKLELHTSYRHAGEVDWRQYRSSMLRTLPHTWRSKEDTRMYTAHFAKKNRMDKEKSDEHADAVHAKEVGFFSSKDPAKGAGKSSKNQAKNSVRRRSKNAKEEAIKDRKGKPLEEYHKERKESPKTANVLVVHRNQGVEVIHLHTGRTLCELPLAANIMHTDINKDGAVDHLEAIIEEGAVIRPEGHQVNDVGNLPCFAWVTTGTPATHSLYNQSICSTDSIYRKMLKTLNSQARRGKNIDIEPETKLQAVTPVSIVRSKNRDEIDRNVDTEDALFLVSDGVLSSFDQAGGLNWQIQTTSYWTSPAMVRIERHDDSLMAGEDMTATLEMKIHPSLEKMKLKPHGAHDHVLVTGMEWASIINEEGEVLAEFLLPDAPVGPPVIGDFDNDGWNDIIFHTRTSLTGMSMKPTRHRKPLSFIMGGLLLLLGTVIVVHLASNTPAEKGAQARRSKKRATD